MKQFFILTLFLLTTLPAHGQSAAKTASANRRAILQTLKHQTENWNTGRIDKFMGSYWPSDSLTFVGATGITYGYRATLDNYKKRYPDRASMGTLKFDILALDLLGADVAYVIGKWHLTRPKIGNVGGHFTLVWRKINNRWLIVSDHTS